jgi:hypothetical protein
MNKHTILSYTIALILGLVKTSFLDSVNPFYHINHCLDDVFSKMKHKVLRDSKCPTNDHLITSLPYWRS